VVLKHAPVFGSFHGFTTTAVKVYNATTPSRAIACAAKGIIMDRTVQDIKYPLLCLEFIVSCGVSVATGGNPFAVSATLNFGEAIVESTLG